MCDNGEWVNNICICNTEYTGKDDFYIDTGTTCQISLLTRQIIIYVLLGMGIINTLISSYKLIFGFKRCKQVINKRLIFSFTLTLLHYLCVIIMCVFLQYYLMNEYLGTIITGSLAFVFGCIEQSFHLVEIIII